ncbi:2173_t:CDS:2 [Funneliformis mosseae]|uniref:2173_t:CDS:1 n=1 Tax=Funneliformis mosseae TaxID=27381 RepID=A0A9N8W1I1_FUNMO|nr:2173_t:CDS:2 [Funneliformis mosseae]
MKKEEESNILFRYKLSYDEELLSTSSKKISTYRNEEEGITQEDVLNSVSEISDTFGETKFLKILNQVHKLLSDYELNFLFERLSLTDENECISEKTRKYITLFDEIIEEESCDNSDLEFENNDITDKRNSEEFEKTIAKMKGKIHQLDSLSEKFHYLSNTFSIPAESYDQSKTPDIFVIKSVSSHLDTITKMNGLMRNTPEHIFTKIDNGYKANSVLEFFKRSRQILLFLLEVLEGPNNPDPVKISKDRKS